MKKVLGVFLLVAMCGGLAGCGQKAAVEKLYENVYGDMVTLEELVADLQPSLYEDYLQDGRVQLVLEQDVWETDDPWICATVFNGRSRATSHGKEMTLEYCYDGQWYQLRRKSRVKNAVGYSVGAGEEEALVEVLEPYYFSFPPGKYRACFCYGSSSDHVAFAEFELVEPESAAGFCDIEEQSLQARQARKDGCVVLKSGNYQNLELAAEFFRQALIRIPGKMRLVDVDQECVTDITYELAEDPSADKYIVETWKAGERTREYYRYLNVIEEDGREQLALSTYSDLTSALQEEALLYEWDTKTILTEPERLKEWKSMVEQLRHSLSYQELYCKDMCMIGRNGKSTFFLDRDAEILNLTVMTTKDNLLYCKDAREGEEILYIFPVGEQDMGALFRTQDGSYTVTRYSGATGRVVTTLTGEKVDIIRELQQQAISLEPLYENVSGDLVTLEQLVAGLKPTIYSKYETNDSVTMVPIRDSWPRNSQIIYCRITNDMDRDIQAMRDYLDIEFLYEGTWYSIPEYPRASVLTAPGIRSGGELDYHGPIGLDYFNFSFPPGTYRACYSYRPEGHDMDQDYVAFAEFELTDDALLTEVCKIQDQSLQEEQAVKDGCMVLVDGTYQNTDRAADFLERAQLGIPCRIRIADLDQKMVLDVIYEPMDIYIYNRFTVTTCRRGKVTTQYFGHLNLVEQDDKSQVVLSNYAGLQELLTEEETILQDWDCQVLFDSEYFDSTVWSEMLDQYSQRGINRRRGGEQMTVFDHTGERVLFLTDRSTYMVFEDEPVWNVKSSEQEERPCYIFRIGDQDYGVLYRTEDGKYFAEWYEGETGALLDTMSGNVDRILRKWRK